MKYLIFILVVVGTVVKGQNLTVMTYNLRYDNPNDGVNAWPKRSQKVMTLLKKNNADIIGVQEALFHQLEDIKKNLPQYAYVGVGRDDGKQNGEFSAIFYDKNRFKVVTSGTFWLSETPDVPGSKNWDPAITRVATWTKLYDIKLKDSLFMINTHFDHIGKVARENSATLIKEKVSLLAGALPVILSGDFNIEPTETPYSILSNGEIYNFRDAGSGNTTGTYCTFKVNSEPCRRIDYIFYGVGFDVLKYSIINQNDGKHYPSDHLPVVAKFKLTALNK